MQDRKTQAVPRPAVGQRSQFVPARFGELARQRTRAFGFAAKLGIHPAQVARANESFSPSAEEVEWARRVVDGARACCGQPFTVDGRMVDLPVIRIAERTLQQVSS